MSQREKYFIILSVKCFLPQMLIFFVSKIGIFFVSKNKIFSVSMIEICFDWSDQLLIGSWELETLSMIGSDTWTDDWRVETLETVCLTYDK